MRLSDLDIQGNRPKIMLVQSPSSKLKMYLEDKMKLKYKIKSDSILNIETKKDYKKIRDSLGIQPAFSDRWFVKLNLTKMHDKELYNIIEESNTCFFFCESEKYATYKSFKERFKKDNLVDFYINYLRKPDFIYLYDALTLSDNKLDKKLFNYVIQSYSGDVEAVLGLFIRLNQGEKFNNRKDIAEVCGTGGNTVESFIFSLLKPISGSDRGLNTVLKNRISAGVDLGNTLGYTKFYNFMSKSIERFCELKELLISGIIYKTVRNLPDNYDEQALSRYQKYLWRIKEIPTSQFLKVRSAMGYNIWRNEIDFLKFIYKLYTIYSFEYLENMKGTI